MKRVISISLEPEQAAALKHLVTSGRARSASDLIRQALHAYAKQHSPTLAHNFVDAKARANTSFTGEGTPAHQPRRRRHFPR